MKKQNNTTKYEKALKHVAKLKEFYKNLMVYAIFIIAWFIYNNQIMEFVIIKTGNTDIEFLNWLKINITLIPILWGLALLSRFLHLQCLKLSFFTNWEERKVKELLEKDEF